MIKKDNTLYYLIGIAVLGGAGFLFWQNWKKKQSTPTPIPEPTPTPTPAPIPGPTPAPSSKIAELQNLMIKRYIQLNRDNEYNAASAKGGWGNLSTNALKYLQPGNFASRGIPNASNIDAWINSIKKDVETAASEVKKQTEKESETAKLKKLASQYAKHFQLGKPIEVLTNFTGIMHKYDSVKNSYVPTKDTRVFKAKTILTKGSTYTSMIDRQNGQIIIVVGGDKYYPTSPSNLIAL
jgi:hypothetical protein